LRNIFRNCGAAHKATIRTAENAARCRHSENIAFLNVLPGRGIRARHPHDHQQVEVITWLSWPLETQRYNRGNAVALPLVSNGD
jgi:hypothetical protein